VGIRAAAFFSLTLLCGFVEAQAPQIGQVSKDSVWVPTPERMIRRLLQMADTTKDDVVIDLGSGDGRIPIYAAKHFGARGIGVELEKNLIDISRSAARKEGVASRVQFIQEDLFKADLSQATVIALYISPGVMTRLQPILLDLRPGTRVVSHSFKLDDWDPDESIVVEERHGHLWVVPARVEGRWAVSLGEESFGMRIERQYQRLSIAGERGGRPLNVIGARLRGNEIRFTSFDRDGNVRHHAGRVDGERMSGTCEGDGRPWTASKVSR
jgi:SAM-dependent methyltransferase